jgi:hypothetical protein
MSEWITYTIRVPRDFQNLNALPWRLGVRSWGVPANDKQTPLLRGKLARGRISYI